MRGERWPLGRAYLEEVMSTLAADITGLNKLKRGSRIKDAVFQGVDEARSSWQ